MENNKLTFAGCTIIVGILVAFLLLYVYDNIVRMLLRGHGEPPVLE